MLAQLFSVSDNRDDGDETGAYQSSTLSGKYSYNMSSVSSGLASGAPLPCPGTANPFPPAESMEDFVS